MLIGQYTTRDKQLGMLSILLMGVSLLQCESRYTDLYRVFRSSQVSWSQHIQSKEENPLIRENLV